MTLFSNSKNDIPILTLSIFAVLLAGVLSWATITGRSEKIKMELASNPYFAAEEAAKAGLEAAKWHIECHGRTLGGSISYHFHINGAMYAAEWGDVNLQDSTVNIKSTGVYEFANGQSYSINLESKIKIEFLPPHTNEILSSYYGRNKGSLTFSQSR